MRKLWSKTGAFTTGTLATVLVVVALMATGVLPVRTETTTVVREKAAATATATTVALTSTDMTPAEIYEKYSAGVVEVLATFDDVSSMTPYGPSSSSGQALGSGFVVAADGSILTNAHVVSNNGATADSVKVVFKTQGGDGTDTTTVVATVVGLDETSDVALLKVDPAKAPALDPLPLGDSSAVQVGEAVVAIGNLRGTKTPIRHLTSGSLGYSDALLTPLHGVARRLAFGAGGRSARPRARDPRPAPPGEGPQAQNRPEGYQNPISHLTSGSLGCSAALLTHPRVRERGMTEYLYPTPLSSETAARLKGTQLVRAMSATGT